jgi:hypothetical protein
MEPAPLRVAPSRLCQDRPHAELGTRSRISRLQDSAPHPPALR